MAEWLENFVVIISDQKWPVTVDQLNGSSFKMCGQYPGIPPNGATVTVKCTPSAVVGRYVYIHQPTSQWMMNICEVEVYIGEWLQRYFRSQEVEAGTTYNAHSWTVEWNHIDVSTALWNNKGTFLDTLFITYFFLVYSSFYTWNTWGGQCELCQFILDFDHWLHLSDILKRATRSKSDDASVWPMQCAWMTLRHGENDCYWRVARVEEVDIKYYKLSKTCYHTQD